MITLDTEKTLALNAQERYDIIGFAIEAADESGFVNSFILNRALYCYAAILLYPDCKEELANKLSKDILGTWNELLLDETIDKMYAEYAPTLEVLASEAEVWYKEYSDYAHSARGILDIIQTYSGDILQDAARTLENSAQESGVKDILTIAEDWGMGRDNLKESAETVVEVDEESLF